MYVLGGVIQIDRSMSAHIKKMDSKLQSKMSHKLVPVNSELNMVEWGT